MREILFRGKTINSEEWAEGNYLYDEFSGTSVIVPYINLAGDVTDFSEHSAAAVITDTVGQYIGLTDKNGKKIFEDDILTIEGVNIYGAIKYREDKSAFFVETENGEDYFGENWDTDVVVIGNIHDNPELLEVLNNEIKNQ